MWSMPRGGGGGGSGVRSLRPPSPASAQHMSDVSSLAASPERTMRNDFPKITGCRLFKEHITLNIGDIKMRMMEAENQTGNRL